MVEIDNLQQWQQQQLSQVFTYHFENNQSYRKWIQQHNMENSKISHQQIPILTKDFFLKNFKNRESSLKSVSCKPKELINAYETSNGSLALYSQNDIDSYLNTWESMLRYHSIEGNIIINALPIGPWSSGRQNDLIRNNLKINSPQFYSVEQHVNNCTRWNPEAIITFPSLLAKLYYYMLKHNINPKEKLSNLRKIFIAGEMSSKGLRNSLGKFFSAEIVDTYACSEVAIIGIENLQGDGLFTFFDRFFIEIVNPITNEPVSEGKVGKLLLTDLKAHTKPIIRYQLGDLVRYHGIEDGYLKLSYVEGRTSEEISVGPAEFTRRALEELLGRFPELSRYYKIIIKEENDKRKKIYLHCVAETSVDSKDFSELSQRLFDSICNISSTFQVVIERKFIHLPEVRVYSEETFPFKECFKPKAKIIEYIIGDK